MGRPGYPAEFRRKVLDLIEAGRSVAAVASDLNISEQTIYVWRRQDRVDRGLEAGLSSAERAELAAARRKIAELEAELAIQWWSLHEWRAHAIVARGERSMTEANYSVAYR